MSFILLRYIVFYVCTILYEFCFIFYKHLLFIVESPILIYYRKVHSLYAGQELQKVNAYCHLIIHSMTKFVLLRF